MSPHLRALCLAGTAVLAAAAPAAAAPPSVTYTGAGEHAFVVPAGVTRVTVALTGARGGGGVFGAPIGGRGAIVSGLLDVSPGGRLYAEVGGPGTNWQSGHSSSTLEPGGPNGGGAGINGGGGATDVRTLPVAATGSLGTRLAVAGGGGGGAAMSGAGGDAGAAGGVGANGGGPGTGTDGGAGGAAGEGGGAAGAAGTLGTGGVAGGPNFRGGGGGGGLYGGGGGGGMGPCSPCTTNGGGGGGSSRVPAGGTSGLAPLTDAAQAVFSWEAAVAQPTATALSFAGTAPGAVSPSQTLTLTNAATSTQLIVSGLSFGSDDFFVGATTCLAPVAPGESCTVSVRFAPAAAGAHAATLHVTSNAAPVDVALSGTAPAAVPPATGPAGPAGPAGPSGKVALVTCRAVAHTKRQTCRVTFVGSVPSVSASRANVRANLSRKGHTYATAHTIARRGALHLTLSARRSLKPGAYTLTLRIGAKRTTRTVVVA
jgi:hypothetical protein